MKKRIKRIIREVAYFIIGLVYAIYLILKNINKTTIRLFNKMPRLARIITIYSLVSLAFIGIYKLVQKQEVQTIVKEKVVVVEKEVIVEKEVVKEQEPKEIAYNFHNENEKNIYNKAIEYGLTDNQALIVISISRHETGNWKSKAFLNGYNFGGIMCNRATKIKKYNSYEEGLNDFVRILKKYYFDLGLTTIEKIGAKYCPVGAKNDPNGLNKYWVGGVTSFYNSYIQSVK